MNKTKNSYSLINLMAINIGTMIGVGIFFKAKGILTTTNNIWIALTTWAIGSALCYGLSLSFVEAGSVTTRTGESGTLANWARLFLGKKTGRLTHMLMSFQYYPIFSVMLVYYAVVFAYDGFGIQNVAWYTTLIITLVAWTALSAANALSYAFGKVFQMVGTVIKFIPLLSVMVLGFANPAVATGTSTFSGMIGDKVATWDWKTVAIALPSVFFAFDGFFGGLALSKEEKNKGDAIKATLFSVVLVAIFYVIFAAAMGWGTKDGDLFTLFTHTFGKNGAKFVYLVISISAMTVANGMMLAGTRALKNTSDDKEFIPIKLIKNTTSDGRFVGQTWLIYIIGIFYALIWIWGTELLGFASPDKLIDDFGNAITLFGYFVYAIIGFGIFRNRTTNVHKTDQVKGIWFVLLSSVVVFSLIIFNLYKYLANWKAEPITAGLIVFSALLIFALAAITNMYEKK